MIDWTIEQIRKTATQLASDNPTLSSGQLAVESDTRRAKIGPGAYASLPYELNVDLVKADAAWEADQRDNGATPSGIISIEGVAYNIYGFIRTSGVDGLVTLDLEALIPGVTDVKWGGAVIASDVGVWACGAPISDSDLSDYQIGVVGSDFNGTPDLEVLITIYAR